MKEIYMKKYQNNCDYDFQRMSMQGFDNVRIQLVSVFWSFLHFTRFYESSVEFTIKI